MNRLQARIVSSHLGWASLRVMRSSVSRSRSLSEVGMMDVFLGAVLRFFGASAPTGSVEFVATSWRELLEKKWASVPQLFLFLEYGVGKEFWIGNPELDFSEVSSSDKDKFVVCS